MKFLPLTLGSIALCWTISPDGLVLLGNLAGRGGSGFFLALLAAFIVFFLISRLFHRAETFAKDDHGLFSAALEPYLALSLTLGCYLGLAVLLPTGALVSAGFIFNETFLYWFPNFGFSFLLLGIVLFCHLLNLSIPRYLQFASVATTLVCLFILAAVGIFKGSSPAVADSAELFTTGADWLYLFSATPLLLLGTLDKKLPDNNFGTERTGYVPVLLTAVIVSALWAAASLLHVPGSQLADSTIPYILGARKILGQPGRIIMGIAIISGALALVNGLLLLLQAALFCELQRFRLRCPAAVNLQRITSLLVCVAIGALMAGGLAGYDILESLIKAVLLLWLLLTGLRALFAGVELRRKTELSGFFLVAPVLLLFAGMYFLGNTGEVVFIVKTILIVLGGSVVVSAGWIRLSRS
jgi:hypothetical protein